MAYEQRDGDIAIFAETDKRNEKAPDWKGTLVLNGQKLEVALWAKGGRGTMLAGSVKPARDAQQASDFRGAGSTGGGGSGGLASSDDHSRHEDPFADEVPFAHPYSIR